MSSWAGSRGTAAVAIVLVALGLAACGPTTVADRTEQWAAGVQARILDEVSVVETAGVSEGARVRLGFGDVLDEPDAATDIGQAMIDATGIVADSPLGSLPVTVTSARAGNTSGCRWNGFDPEHADRYLAAVTLWVELNRGDWLDLEAVPEVDVYLNSIGVRLRPTLGADVPQDIIDMITLEMSEAGFDYVSVGTV
jgi:hypothetical protein